MTAPAVTAYTTPSLRVSVAPSGMAVPSVPVAVATLPDAVEGLRTRPTIRAQRSGDEPSAVAGITCKAQANQGSHTGDAQARHRIGKHARVRAAQRRVNAR